MKYPLKTRQIALFFIAFLPTIKFFMLPSVLSKTASEDMWICSVFNLLLDGITLSVILIACKRYKCDFYTLLESHFGKTVARIVFILYFIYFLMKSVLPTIEQKDYIETTLYVTMPNNLYFVPFFLLAFFIACKKLNVIARISDVLWIVTLIGVVILLVMSTSNVDLTNVLPIYANGTKKIVTGSYFALSWFGDCAYLLFFIGNFKWENKSRLKITMGFLIGAFIVIVFMIFFYSVFTSIAFREQFALTEITKYTTVINNTGRIDYLGIMMVIFTDMFSAILPYYFAVHVLDRVLVPKRKWLLPLIVACVLIIITVLLTEFTHTIEKFSVVYAGWFYLTMANVLPIIFCLIPPKEKYNEEYQN
ncbi:MAG: GerAB/ArcD/ProY family transporter [Clostridia bacterium]|nr:GerAB/ArcD/ProY family transporter [Clostridia bacterium]